MRQGLKNRIKFDPSNPPIMNNIKTDYLSKNSFNTRVKDTYCAPNGSCSNNRDASGNYIGVSQKQQQTQRKYYAPFRQPLKGYRKTLNCPEDGAMFKKNRRGCLTTTEIYKDTYAVLDPKDTNCLDNGSISTSKIPLTGSASATKSKSIRLLFPAEGKIQQLVPSPQVKPRSLVSALTRRQLSQMKQDKI